MEYLFPGASAFDVPANQELGLSDLVVVTNIPSQPVTVTVQ
jgi:hypothetical protein